VTNGTMCQSSLFLSFFSSASVHSSVISAADGAGELSPGRPFSISEVNAFSFRDMLRYNRCCRRCSGYTSNKETEGNVEPLSPGLDR